MPISVVEFGVMFASVFLIAWRLQRFNGPHSQLPSATRFKTSTSRGAHPGPRLERGSANLRGVTFCAIVSSNLPRIEKPR
jgi:hypothetical protein